MSFGALFDALLANVERVIQGKREPVHLALVCLFAEGHLLIEDVPGVGKTSMAKAIARSIDGTWSRIQFTPDLLPSDVTGVSVWNREEKGFDCRPGGVFPDTVLANEINRASPKTQSALLEAMEEHQVTVDAHTYSLPGPFMVIATQNPIELEGTYPLPEAQLDRFLMRVQMGYPSHDAERAILETHGSHASVEELAPVPSAVHGRSPTCTWPTTSSPTSSISSLRRVSTATSPSASVRVARSPSSALHARSPPVSGATTSFPTT